MFIFMFNVILFYCDYFREKNIFYIVIKIIIFENYLRGYFLSNLRYYEKLCN